MWFLTFHLCSVSTVWDSVSHCFVGSCFVSDHINLLNTPAPFLFLYVGWYLAVGLFSACGSRGLLSLSFYIIMVMKSETWTVCVSCFFFLPLQAVKLSYWALLRDSIYYTFSVTALIAVRAYRFSSKYTGTGDQVCGGCTVQYGEIWQCLLLW